MEAQRHHRIETPEKIVFSYEIASPGARMGAWVVDFLIQGAALLLLSLLAGLLGAVSGAGPSGGAFLAGFVYLAWFFCQWVYFSLFELRTGGGSPGKRAMGLAVIRADGEPLDAATVIMRNLMRAVDSLPGFNLLGGVVCVIDRRGRRLGDIAADTLVVHRLPQGARPPSAGTELRTATAGPSAGRKLGEEELLTLRKFISGSDALPAARREELARSLAGKVAARLGEEVPAGDPMAYLEEVYGANADPER